MNLIYFIDWWDNIYKHDSLYSIEGEKEMYGIILCFSKSSVINYIEKNKLEEKDLKYIKPVYPWKNEIMEHIKFLN
jgi:hypothetical protein